ncbi:MAG: hypothetical protein OEO77_14620 [Acidimicrobiia bacterium]|nr:hypothetical protein [Acidimicrobiia bacterium]
MFGKGRFGISFVLGLLALPLAAVAATALVSANRQAVDSPVVTVPVTNVRTLPGVTPVIDTSPATQPIDSAVDLERACGEAGLQLVDRESRNELSELEAAALTALRVVCESEGMPLPGPPVPEPVVRTVTVEQVTSTVAAAPSVSSRGDDHDEREDHEEDEHDEREGHDDDD